MTTKTAEEIIDEVFRLRAENHKMLEEARKVPYIDCDDMFIKYLGSLCGIEEACDMIIEAAGFGAK